MHIHLRYTTLSLIAPSFKYNVSDFRLLSLIIKLITYFNAWKKGLYSHNKSLMYMNKNDLYLCKQMGIRIRSKLHEIKVH